MNPPYEIDDVSEIFSPGLVIYKDIVEQNLHELIRLAGGPQRLCPHCKTHKTAEITRMALELGITSHKCATIAEAEMLCNANAKDVLVAYQLIGPNLKRFARLIDIFPRVRFATIVDSLAGLEALSETMKSSSNKVEVLLDLDTGMKRTGIELGENAVALYDAISTADGIQPGGLHWYDGHNRQADAYDRKVAVETGWTSFLKFRDQLLLDGFKIPRIVAGGIGSFAIIANKEEPLVQVSPGTPVLHDAAMAELLPEFNLKPAIGILTRVISNNREGHLTLDVGHKSCAADQPAGKRLYFPDLAEAEEVQQTEEHLVIRTEKADEFSLGDHLLAIPRHACPTSAVHQFANVISKGKLVERWNIIGRDRMLTI